MQRIFRPILPSPVGIAAVCACIALPNDCVSGAEKDSHEWLKEIGGELENAGRQGTVIGAQIAFGTSDAAAVTMSMGVVAPRSRRLVDDQTQFCIGSCSKPFAAFCIVALADDGQVDLDIPIHGWVPSTEKLTLSNGRSTSRAPSLRELLAHRGGIFSQKTGPITPAQRRAIRDFTLTLKDSVDIICQQPLITAPGEKYAYSGAGYCLAGFAVQQATGTEFEQLLQTQICRPLGLTRTTYFPSPRESNIALPGMTNRQGQLVPHSGSPHLLKSRLRFPLIGGSLYSTAAETATFARMILNQGRVDDHQFLNDRTWDDFARQQFNGQSYGIGWGLRVRNKKVVALQHTGALMGYRSLIAVDFEKDHYAVIHWTLSDPAVPSAGKLQNKLEKLAFR